VAHILGHRWALGVPSELRFEERYNVSVHRTLRKRIAPKVDAGLTTCARCGKPIEAGTPWDLAISASKDMTTPERLRRRRAMSRLRSSASGPVAPTKSTFARGPAATSTVRGLSTRTCRLARRGGEASCRRTSTTASVRRRSSCAPSSLGCLGGSPNSSGVRDLALGNLHGKRRAAAHPQPPSMQGGR
jgi:hypothetical protein